jgi:predicted DNA-binding transcriptional regulator AlpA
MHTREHNAVPEASGGREAPRRKMRPRDAASYLGASESTLAKWRLRGDGPPYSKCGPRLIIYDIADIDAWIAGRKRSSTSEDGGARVGS